MKNKAKTLGKFLRLFVFAYGLFILYSCSPRSQKVTGTKGSVQKVISGNKIQLASGLKVRILGVEDDVRSQQYMEKNLVGKRVLLIGDSGDKQKSYKSANKSTVRAYIKVLDTGEPLNRFLLANHLSTYNGDYVNDSTQLGKRLDPFHQHTPLSQQQIADIGRPATFMIVCEDGSAGTGFFINDNGLALTNNHVFDGTQAAIALLFDQNGNMLSDSKRTLKLIKTISQKTYDYSIIKVDMEGGERSPFLVLGGDRFPHTADPIVCIGNPLVGSAPVNTMSKVTTGHLTKVDCEEAEFDWSRIDGKWGMIQHDATVDHGNSGGPVIDQYGEVVSIVTNAAGGIERQKGETVKGNFNWGVDIRIVKRTLDNLDLNYAGR